jgi:IS5 family transposase
MCEALKDCAAEFVIVRRHSTYKKLDSTDPVRKFLCTPRRASARRVEHVFHWATYTAR